jgi:hypothetical protein
MERSGVKCMIRMRRIGENKFVKEGAVGKVLINRGARTNGQLEKGNEDRAEACFMQQDHIIQVELRRHRNSDAGRTKAPNFRDAMRAGAIKSLSSFFLQGRQSRPCAEFAQPRRT